MPAPNRTHLADLRGVTRLAFDATAGIAHIVERMHRTIQLTPLPLGRPATDSPRGITGFVYRSVRGSMQLIGKGVDAGLAPLAAMLPEGEATPARDAFVSAVNGVYGDYLLRTSNPLAIEMSLRHVGRDVDLREPAAAFRDSEGAPISGKLLVLVHGLCLNDRAWRRNDHDHGSALATDLGYTPLYLRYNSGLHVAANGRGLADALETLVEHWPHPVEELVIVGHSMGGLVARSACHYGRGAGHAWPKRLAKLVFLGTPHHGAPLERGGHRLDYVLDLSPYSAPFTKIGKSRSAGITDLRHGTVAPGAHAHVALPPGVRCYAAAATLGAKRDRLSERLIGDGLVPLNSALGRHADRARSLRIPKSRQWIGYGMGHLELLSRPEVYAQLRDWLRESL
jgi:pimeloyl-ACP methyl ester carboxylesterase